MCFAKNDFLAGGFTMVNALQRKRGVVVKLADEWSGDCTAKGGAGVLEAFARRVGLWGSCRRLVAGRRGAGQGFETTAVVSSLVHGLLCGGRGLSATEPMRGDGPLLSLLGLDRAPSAETVEEVVKYLGGLGMEASGLGRLVADFGARLLGREVRRDLLRDGFVMCFGDGSHLEVDGSRFEACSYHRDKGWGLDFGSVFVGPYVVACDFAGEGEGEQKAVERIVPGALEVLVRTGLRRDALMLMDSLYGHESTLKLLEDRERGVSYVVGANNLQRAMATLEDRPDGLWRAVKAGRGWERVEVCTFWLECEGWSGKRLCVGRRARREGELLWRHFALVTNLHRDDSRMKRLMREHKLCFEEAVWRLYDGKQGCENLWKDQLCDLGLHHPPSARVSANAAFYAIAMVAANLAAGFRRLVLPAASRPMRLWRLRREIIDMAATVARHGRCVLLRLRDARTNLAGQLRHAMLRVARL
jgi:hypothetical protein